jgi:CelD/BcsL family acetyltransferase involved in cellulose biosynthesis
VTATGRDAREVLGPAWDDAWQSSREATIFQSSGWYLSWLDTVGHEAEPIVLRASSRDGSLVGVALQWDASTSTVSPLSSPWADYHDVIGAVDDLASKTLADALIGLANEGAHIELNEVRPGSALARLARRAGLRRSPGTPTHAIDLRNSATVRRILDRREHVTKMRRLHRIGHVQLMHHPQGPTLDERLRRFITMHRTQWRGRPDVVAPFDGGAVDELFRELTARCPGTCISELTVAGEPIAMQYGFLWDRTYRAYRPTYDPAMRRISPGQLLLRSMVDDFAKRGFDRLDLMRGDYDHKAKVADVRNENLTFATGPSVVPPEVVPRRQQGGHRGA